MSETNVDDQNEPTSEEPEKEVQNVDDEEATEKVVKDKHPSPIPDASIYARASMFNQSVAKKNGQLHRLFLNNRTDECLIIIEVSFNNQKYFSSNHCSNFWKNIPRRFVNTL